MKATITDPGMLQSVKLDNVTEYLESRGWTAKRGVLEGSTVWELTAGEERYAALLPDVSGYLDYPSRIHELLRLLAEVESRSEMEILRAISTVGIDVVRVRAVGGDASLGSISLRAGAGLVRQAWEMMAAAATAAVAPHRVIPSRRPAQAEAYMNSIELGQSEKGSYVVTVLSRVDAASEQGELFTTEAIPYQRKVTQTLARGLAAAKAAAGDVIGGEGLERFESAVNSGVSANLCEAIAGMIVPGPEDMTVEYSIAWSVQIPSGSEPSRVAFNASESRVLAEAARFLRATDPDTDLLINGIVIDLHREAGEEVGAITLSCFVGGAMRKVRVPLGPEDYQRAIEAHDTRRSVRLRADLRKSGKRLMAENVQGFELE
jgi:hypothetical protein